jgi:hypothetical protein
VNLFETVVVVLAGVAIGGATCWAAVFAAVRLKRATPSARRGIANGRTRRGRGA